MVAVLRDLPELLAEATGRPAVRLEPDGTAGLPGQPLLGAATIALDVPWFEQAVKRIAGAAIAGGLADRASPWSRLLADGLDVALPPLLAALLREDSSRIEAVARAWGIEPAEFATLIRYAALPVLGACAAQLRAKIPPSWDAGYCPVCGAWPALAEIRGIEQTRRLRCGRCGADWAGQWLRCVFCAEADHTRLGSLLPEGGLAGWSLETCTGGHYLKSHYALTAASLFELLLDDLESVELDVVARTRGLERPSRLGCSPEPDVRRAE